MAPTHTTARPAVRPLSILRHAEDFQRALAQPWVAKTPHFALHYLAPQGLNAEPTLPAPASGPELSPSGLQSGTPPVDNYLNNPVEKQVRGCGETPCAALTCFGMVVPKRLARRAVTRNLIKRQMRQVLGEGHAASSDGLPAGSWVVRLRQGFDRKVYPSAASEALRRHARAELLTLVGQGVQRARKASAP